MITATRRPSLTRHHKLLQGAALTRCQAPLDGVGACRRGDGASPMSAVATAPTWQSWHAAGMRARCWA